ncbi:MAG: hypothetical protein ABI679_03615 [Gemmatimonadota bacterium]
MSVSSLASMRQFPEAVRPRLQVAYARAREALITTHAEQAAQFTREFSRRLPAFDALDLYFKVVAVPLPMEDCIISRALVSLDLDRLQQVPTHPTFLELIKGFHFELAFEGVRRQRQFLEVTLQLARLAGARASEAVLVTHVDNAMRIVDILEDTIWVDEAVSHYIHTFRLPLSTAHMVFQRARAQVVDRHLSGMMVLQGPVAAQPPKKEFRLPDQTVRIAG